MRHIILGAALALSACTTIPGSPGTVANQTILDEQIGIGAEVSYKAARLATELAVDLGKLNGANATKAAELDRKAYAALGVMRQAYTTGNATSYAAAAAQAQSAVAELLTIIR